MTKKKAAHHGQSTKKAKKPKTALLSATSVTTALKQQSPNQLNLPSPPSQSMMTTTSSSPRSKSHCSDERSSKIVPVSSENEKPNREDLHFEKSKDGAGQAKGVVIEAQDSPIAPEETSIYPSPPSTTTTTSAFLPSSPSVSPKESGLLASAKKSTTVTAGYLSTLTNAIVKPLSTASSVSCSTSVKPLPSIPQTSSTIPSSSSSSSSSFSQKLPLHNLHHHHEHQYQHYDQPPPPEREREREERRGRSRRPRILWRSELDEPTWAGLEECWNRLCRDEERRHTLPRLWVRGAHDEDEGKEERRAREKEKSLRDGRRLLSRDGKRWSDELDTVGM